MERLDHDSIIVILDSSDDPLKVAVAFTKKNYIDVIKKYATTKQILTYLIKSLVQYCARANKMCRDVHVNIEQSLKRWFNGTYFIRLVITQHYSINIRWENEKRFYFTLCYTYNDQSPVKFNDMILADELKIEEVIELLTIGFKQEDYPIIFDEYLFDNFKLINKEGTENYTQYKTENYKQYEKTKLKSSEISSIVSTAKETIASHIMPQITPGDWAKISRISVRFSSGGFFEGDKHKDLQLGIQDNMTSLLKFAALLFTENNKQTRPHQGGKSPTKFILGRQRAVTKVGRKQLIMYRKQLISVTDARQIEKN